MMKKTLLKCLLISISILNNSCIDTSNYKKQEAYNGLVKEVELRTYNAKEKFGEIEKGSLKFKTITKFNEKGEKVFFEWYFGEDLYRDKIFKKGRLLEENSYTQSGELSSKKIYTYNNEGINTGYVEYNSDGSFSTKTISKFNDVGKKVSEVKYSDKNLSKIWYGNTYTYSKDNKIIMDKYFDDKGIIYVKFYTYGTNFSNITLRYPKGDIYPNGITFLSEKRIYLPNGEEDEVIFYDDKGREESHLIYSYEYDENNNWIKRIAENSFEGRSHSYTEREILYY